MEEESLKIVKGIGCTYYSYGDNYLGNGTLYVVNSGEDTEYFVGVCLDSNNQLSTLKATGEGIFNTIINEENKEEVIFMHKIGKKLVYQN